MRKNLKARKIFLGAFLAVLIVAAYECFSPRMSPEKFARNTYVLSLDPPVARYPRTTIVARVSNRYSFYQRSSKEEGKQKIGIDLAEFNFNADSEEEKEKKEAFTGGEKKIKDSHGKGGKGEGEETRETPVLDPAEISKREGSYLPRSYFLGEKVRVRKFVISSETTATKEDVRVVQQILLRKPFDREALEKAPLTAPQKALLRFYFFGMEGDTTKMMLLVEAKPKKVTVTFDPKQNCVDISVSAEIISAEPRFEPASQEP